MAAAQTLDKRPRTTLAYTFSETGKVLINSLLDKNHVLQLYNPIVKKEESERISHIKNEAIILHEDGIIHETDKWQDVLDFKPDLLIFECLDVLPSLTDKQFLCNAKCNSAVN